MWVLPKHQLNEWTTSGYSDILFCLFSPRCVGSCSRYVFRFPGASSLEDMEIDDFLTSIPRIIELSLQLGCPLFYLPSLFSLANKSRELRSFSVNKSKVKMIKVDTRFDKPYFFRGWPKFTENVNDFLSTYYIFGRHFVRSWRYRRESRCTQFLSS